MTPTTESFVARAEKLAESAKKVNDKPEAERAAEVLRIREEMQKLRAEIRAERAKGVLEDTKRKLDDLKAAPGIHAELVEEFEQTSSKAKDRLDQLAAPVDTDEMIADAKRGGDYRFVFSPEQMIQLAAAPADTQKLKDWGTAAGTDKAAVGRLADAITAALATAPEATKTTLKPLVDALRTIAPATTPAPGTPEAFIDAAKKPGDIVMTPDQAKSLIGAAEKPKLIDWSKLPATTAVEIRKLANKITEAGNALPDGDPKKREVQALAQELVRNAEAKDRGAGGGAVADLIDEGRADPNENQVLGMFKKGMKMFKNSFAAIIDTGIGAWKTVRQFMGATPAENDQANVLVNTYREYFGNDVMRGKVNSLVKEQLKASRLYLVEGKQDGIGLTKLRGTYNREIDKRTRANMALPETGAIPADRTAEFTSYKTEVSKTLPLASYIAEQVTEYANAATIRPPAGKIAVFTLMAVAEKKQPAIKNPTTEMPA